MDSDLGQDAHDVRGCARCGGDHAALLFQPLKYAVKCSCGEAFTHWAPCPVNQQPILMCYIDGDEGSADGSASVSDFQLPAVSLVPDPPPGCEIVKGPGARKRYMVDDHNPVSESNLGDIEGRDVFYVINRGQSEFTKIIGCHAVFGPKGAPEGEPYPVDACFFENQESAEAFLEHLRSLYPEIHQYSEVRKAEIPYADQLFDERAAELLAASRYSGSKDWVNGGYTERIEWLITMYEAKKDELDQFLAGFEKSQEQVRVSATTSLYGGEKVDFTPNRNGDVLPTELVEQARELFLREMAEAGGLPCQHLDGPLAEAWVLRADVNSYWTESCGAWGPLESATVFRKAKGRLPEKPLQAVEQGAVWVRLPPGA